jgi:hypothetical protein
MRSVLSASLPVLLLAVAACQAGDKPAIDDAPFAGDYDGKTDSWLRPWDAGSLLIGEQRTATFDAIHGWLSYQIELAPGPVDIDLADAASGSSGDLDTLLVVYGPRRDSGRYPHYALAVNDDVVPGDNLNSHLLLDVPAPGTYRIVVSTFDNYVSYPSNASRGDAVLTVKCPRTDDGIDTCGPHLRFLGEDCFDDASCGSGNHCEGAITCEPGTLCIYTKPGVCTADDA